MVIIVEAGAVAEANAARTMEKDRSIFRIQKVRTNTNTEAVSASASVMTTTFPVLFFSLENLKNSPVLKAMKASAISARKLVPSMICTGTRWKQYGPIRIPAVMYAVTFGSLHFLVMRVSRKPENSMIAMDMMMTATGDCSFNFS